MSAGHDADEPIPGGGSALVLHDQRILLGETRLGLDVGIARRLGLALTLPLRVFDTEIHYLDAANRDEVAIANPELHHRTQRLVGVGDPWLLLRRSAALGTTMLEARGGVTIPLGKTQEDPFRLGDLGMSHEHFQFGTGTVNIVASLAARHGFGKLALSGFGLAVLVVDANQHGYHAGNRFAGGLDAESALGTGSFRFRGSVKAQAETAETWRGEAPDGDGNLGRFDLLAGIGVSWRATSDWSLTAGLDVPVVSRVVGGQLDMPAILDIGVSGRFQLWGGNDQVDAQVDAHAGHDHGEGGHDHGDEPAAHGDEHAGHGAPTAATAIPTVPGLDIVDVVTAGESIDLVPVSGKLPVFDFWAPWCEPCHVLDAKLRALAAEYPERLAIRRVNVVDWDSPAAVRYLAPKSYNLPHLRLYGAAGTLLHEGSGSPTDLAAIVAGALGK